MRRDLSLERPSRSGRSDRDRVSWERVSAEKQCCGARWAGSDLRDGDGRDRARARGGPCHRCSGKRVRCAVRLAVAGCEDPLLTPPGSISGCPRRAASRWEESISEGARAALPPATSSTQL